MSALCRFNSYAVDKDRRIPSRGANRGPVSFRSLAQLSERLRRGIPSMEESPGGNPGGPAKGCGQQTHKAKTATCSMFLRAPVA